MLRVSLVNKLPKGPEAKSKSTKEKTLFPRATRNQLAMCFRSLSSLCQVKMAEQGIHRVQNVI